MTIDELKALKEYAATMLRGHANEDDPLEATFTEQDRQILRLIDSEIDRQSVTGDEIKGAIDWFKRRSTVVTDDLNDTIRATYYQLAIQALQAYRPEREPCEMCGIKELPKNAGPHDFYVFCGCLWHCDSVFGWEGAKINWCPNCGRRLEE